MRRNATQAPLWRATAAVFLAVVALPACEPPPPDPPPSRVLECDPPPREPQSLAEFSRVCETATGINVPAFNCDRGTEVPETNLSGSYPSAFCDRPNVLNGVCDPGSRFQVVNETKDAIVVAHCRKQNLRGDYGDIAIIQYNQNNGATCFYQALNANPPAAGPLDRIVTPPIEGNGPGKFPWLNPVDTAKIKCVRCHDTGAFVRSPYLAQLNGDPKNRLPGTKSGSGPWEHRMSWNSSQPYTFVGADFQSWKAYSISITGTGDKCISCHRLGISSIGGNFLLGDGTAQNLGPKATDREQLHKNPHSATSPIWMTPGQTTYSQANYDAASAAKSCAEAIVEKQNNPAAQDPPSGCNFVQVAQGNTCSWSPVRGTINGATQAAPTTSPSDVVIDTGTCSSGDCPIGFCYFRTVHGPFWRKSRWNDDLNAPGHVGSFLRIEANAGRWQIHAKNDPEPGIPIAPPGGTFECVAFPEIAKVPDATQCGSNLFSVVDKDGSIASSSAPTPSKNSLYPLTGYIGNVAQVSGIRQTGDTVRASDSTATVDVSQKHTLSPPAPLKTGPLSAESWTSGCNSWAPDYAVKDVYTDSDVQLVPSAQAKDVRCFITGVSGAWSTTRNGGTLQPFAEIYADPYGNVRLRVSPAQQGESKDGIGAYASCIKIR